MTSSPETALPVGKRRKWRSGGPRLSGKGRVNLRRIVVFALCIGAFGVALLAFRSVIANRVDPESARAALTRSQEYLKASNASAARSQAFGAVRADPQWGEAHLALARASLALDEGIAAEASLRRAVDNGIDPKRIHALMAHAILLQGDPRRALVEANKAPEADRLYALRVRTRAYLAGGNLAAAVALACRDEGIALAAQLLLYPATDLLRLKGMPEKAYLGEEHLETLGRDPRASPLYASHAGLAPAILGVGPHDFLYGDNMAYAQALRAAGVPLTLREFPTLNHGFFSYTAISEDSLHAAQQLCADLNAHFEGASRA